MYSVSIGADWVHSRAITSPVRIGLVGPTMAELRLQVIESYGGLVMRAEAAGYELKLEYSKGKIVYPNGSVVWLFTSTRPDALRGVQLNYAWAAGVSDQDTLDNLIFATRLGNEPQTLVTL